MQKKTDKKHTIQSIVHTGIGACLTIIFVLSGYHVSSIGTKEFARQIGAGVGATAVVPENRYNVLASALSKKENMLNEREAALIARESALPITQKDTILLSVFLATVPLLFFLVLFNFYLDWRRNPTQMPQKIKISA